MRLTLAAGFLAGGLSLLLANPGLVPQLALGAGDDGVGIGYLSDKTSQAAPGAPADAGNDGATAAEPARDAGAQEPRREDEEHDDEGEADDHGWTLEPGGM